MGGIVSMFPDLSGATFDDEHLHRTSLWRIWESALDRLLWVLLNPSDADAQENDPTVRKCIGFARRWGYGSIEVVNLYTRIATDPDDLMALIRQSGEAAALAPRADEAILDACARAKTVVAGWGSQPFAAARGRAVGKLLAAAHPNVVCLATNDDGSPRHPLYVGYRTVPFPFAYG